MVCGEQRTKESGERQQAEASALNQDTVGKPMEEEKLVEEKGKRRRGPSISTIILVLILLAGVGIFLYPSVSDWWNSMHATRAISGYVTAVEDLSAQEREDKSSTAVT